jgi:hypothetical protein
LATTGRKGLPHLAKGGDAQLRQLAEQDLAAPKESAAQTQVGRRLVDIGRRHTKAKKPMPCGSVPAIGTIVPTPTLTSGFNRLKVEKRLEELVEIRQRRAAHPLSPGRKLAASAPKPLERSILSQKLRWQY